MANRKGAPIPPASHKTLLKWIEYDDGDPTSFIEPACSANARALHARIFLDPNIGARESCEPLACPPGLSLPPLG